MKICSVKEFYHYAENSIPFFDLSPTIYRFEHIGNSIYYKLRINGMYDAISWIVKHYFLPESYTKEALLKAFDLNEQRMEKRNLDNKMELLLLSVKLLESHPEFESNHGFPLTRLEGEGLKNKIAELKKGKGLDWDKESGQEM